MTPTNKRLTQGELQQYFEAFSKRFLRDDSPENVDIEVLSVDTGDQFETEGARLHGITYDRDTRELDVIFDNGEHHVFNLSELWVAEDSGGFVNAIYIDRGDGMKEIIRLSKAPLPSDPRTTKPTVRSKPDDHETIR